jgi:hypothetical protein
LRGSGKAASHRAQCEEGERAAGVEPGRAIQRDKSIHGENSLGLGLVKIIPRNVGSEAMDFAAKKAAQLQGMTIA